MKTVKRLILLEATFKRIPTYTGTLTTSAIIVHQHIHLVDQLRGV